MAVLTGRTALGIGEAIAVALAGAGAAVAINYRKRAEDARQQCRDRQPLAEISEQDWDEILTVNLKSCFLLTQAVLPGMRARRWGRIINLSSVAAQTGGVVGPHYAASKAGIIGLTHSYASLLAREGITANAIAPALIETEMVTSNPAARPDLIPVGRFGTVEETAAVAVMLASNGYITGQTINVNGDWCMS